MGVRLTHLPPDADKIQAEGRSMVELMHWTVQVRPVTMVKPDLRKRPDRTAPRPGYVTVWLWRLVDLENHVVDEAGPDDATTTAEAAEWQAYARAVRRERGWAPPEIHQERTGG